MFSKISALILQLLDWKFDGTFPPDISKYLIIAMPHTSNWDFPLGLLIRSAAKVDAKFAGKHTLFRFPFGGLFRWLGGYPVDRSQRTNYVDTVVNIYNAKESFILTIAPEGTRKKVEQLKSGFYYIALGARIPIVMIRFDYGTHIISISKPFYPTGDKQADFAFINKFYRGAVGKVPENSWRYGE